MSFCYKYMNVFPIIALFNNTKRVRIWISINLYIILIPLFISIYFSIKNSSTRSILFTKIKKLSYTYLARNVNIYTLFRLHICLPLACWLRMFIPVHMFVNTIQEMSPKQGFVSPRKYYNKYFTLFFLTSIFDISYILADYLRILYTLRCVRACIFKFPINA